MEAEIYKKYADGRAKSSPCGKNMLKAFLIGGTICAHAQALFDLYRYLGVSEEFSGTLTSCSLIVITAILTGFGVFDKIAKHAGAGTLVPITGFANAVASSAIDNKTEGYIFGVGAKIFTIAGPVILYGLSAGVLYGIIYSLFFYL